VNSAGKMTPGPWTVGKAGGDWEIGNMGDPATNGGTLAYVPDTHPESQANARAIAALPDLVEALRGLLDAASTTADDAWAVLERPAAVADAALAKLDAEGGEA